MDGWITASLAKSDSRQWAVEEAVEQERLTDEIHQIEISRGRRKKEPEGE